jgi:MFS family permease
VKLARPQFRVVLSDRNFLLLWSSQAVCAFGERLSQLAILRIIFEGHEPQIAEGVSLILFMFLLPGFLLGPLTARWVDRMDRRLTMMRSDLARAVLIGLVPVFWLTYRSLESFYALLFGLGLVAAFYLPARLALVPKLTHSVHLVAANSAIYMSAMAGSILGVPLGYVFAQRFGLVGGCVGNAVAYFCSALLIWRVRVHAPQELQQPSGSRHLFKEFVEGLSSLRRNLHAMGLVSLSIAANIVTGFSVVAVATFAKQGLGRREDAVIFLMGGAGVGMALGYLLAGRSRLAARWKALPLVALVAIGALCVLLPFAARLQPDPKSLANLLACTAVMLSIGVCAAMLVAPVDTQTQQAVPEEMRGRIFAVRSTVTTAVFLVSLLLGAWAVSQLGAAKVLIGLGVVVTLGTLVVATALLAAERMRRLHGQT